MNFFRFDVINWLNFDLEHNFFIEISLKDPSEGVQQTYIKNLSCFGVMS